MAVLNEGLVGQAAKDEARGRLVHVLPASLLEAIDVEERKVEEIKNKAYKMIQLGVRGEIQCSKIMADSLGIQKSKAKALLALAKSNLIEENRDASRDEASMMAVWIKEATSILNQRETKQKEKLESKLQTQSANPRLQRGLTIRSALSIDSGAISAGDVNLKKSDRNAANLAVESSSESANLFPAEDCISYILQRAQQREKEKEQRLESTSLGKSAAAAAEQENRRLLLDLQSKRKNAKIQQIISARESLPAYQMREDIIRAINSDNQIILVLGDTGACI